MSNGLYHLDAKGEPVKARNVYEWAPRFEELMRTGGNRVDLTERDGVAVSTVFLGIDNNYHSDGPPVLWETKVFCKGPADGDEREETECRCAGSREQAQAMHARVCAEIWPAVEATKELE